MNMKIIATIVMAGTLIAIGTNSWASDDRYENEGRGYSEYSSHDRDYERREYRDQEGDESREYRNREGDEYSSRGMERDDDRYYSDKRRFDSDDNGKYHERKDDDRGRGQDHRCDPGPVPPDHDAPENHGGSARDDPSG